MPEAHVKMTRNRIINLNSHSLAISDLPTDENNYDPGTFTVDIQDGRSDEGGKITTYNQNIETISLNSYQTTEDSISRSGRLGVSKDEVGFQAETNNEETSEIIISSFSIKPDGVYYIPGTNAPLSNTDILGIVTDDAPYNVGKIGFIEGPHSGNFPYKLASGTITGSNSDATKDVIDVTVPSTGLYQLNAFVFGSGTLGGTFNAQVSFDAGYSVALNLYPSGSTSNVLSGALAYYAFPSVLLYCSGTTNVTVTVLTNTTGSIGYTAGAVLYKTF